jgi:hypothetical protein
MAIAGNPKKIAQDIAAGFQSLSPPGLKKYNPMDLKIILNNLDMVKREIRQTQVPQDNVPLIKAKNMQISRMNQAEMVLRSYCKKMRIPL